HARGPAVLLAHHRRHQGEDAVDRVARDAAVLDRAPGRLEREAHRARAGELPEARQTDAGDGVAVAEAGRVAHLRAREGERRAAEQLSLPRLVLAPDLALDAALAALVGDARHAPPAGDDVTRPGELREARLEPADRAHAASLH